MVQGKSHGGHVPGGGDADCSGAVGAVVAAGDGSGVAGGNEPGDSGRLRTRGVRGDDGARGKDVAQSEFEEILDEALAV
jgi:hypothetical protein